VAGTVVAIRRDAIGVAEEAMEEGPSGLALETA